jgi:creatinine amidohydrolase
MSADGRPGASHQNWADLTSPTLEGAISRDPVAVVPIGSVEQHGRHLPVGTDAFAAEAIARGAASRWTAEQPLLLLPTLWTGLSPHHMGLPGSLTLRTSTFIDVVQDVCTSLLHHGVRRIVLLNGHGGNVSALGVVLARLGEQGLPVERVAVVTYWHLVAHRTSEFRDTRHGGTGHAGEFETSLMLATHEQLVKEGAEVCYPELPSDYLSTDLFAEGLAKRYVAFDRLSETGTLGDPSAASAEKGRRILIACSEELHAFLTDFASW